MKRLIFVILLCSLAAATIFATTSCKGIKSTISGDPYIPPEDGMYVDLGYGLNADPEVIPTTQKMLQAPGFGISESDPIKLVSGKELKDIIPLSLKGSRIVIAARLSPSEMENRATIATEVTNFYLYPLTQVDEYKDQWSYYPTQCEGGCYICNQADVIKTVSADKSNYDKKYIYLEISDIPPSPTGWYGFYYADTLMFLRQR